MKRPRGDRAVLALTTEGFLSRLSFGLVNLAVPLYALQLKLNIEVIGILTSVNVIIQIVLKPIMGTVTDRLGPRRSLIWAIALRSAVPLAFIVARVPWQLFVIRLFYGFTQAWRDPALNAVIADAGGKKKVASAFAWYHTAKNTASAIGRAIAGVLLTVTGANYPLVFAVGFGLSILPLAAILRGLPDHVGRRTAADEALDALPVIEDPVVTRQVRRRVAGFTGLGFLYGLTAGMLGLFPVIAKQYFGLSAAAIGLIMLASTVVILVSGPLFGWLADNVNRNVVLLVRAVANTCSSLVFLVANGAVTVGAGRALDDMGKAAFRPAWGSIMAEVAELDRRKRARTMSFIDVGEDAGDAAGPVLAGWLLAIGGLPAMLLTRIGLAVVTEAATFVMTHRRPAEAPKPLVFSTRVATVGAAVAPLPPPLSPPLPPPDTTPGWVEVARQERRRLRQAAAEAGSGAGLAGSVTDAAGAVTGRTLAGRPGRG